MTINSVCVFCGSRLGENPQFVHQAEILGRQIAARGWRLVYGGGSVGLMGVVANAALGAGAEVIGVIPEFLATRELLHTGVTTLKIVASMHERKAEMANLSDAFIALPGGYGTLEELFEVITWSQLGLHSKPIGLLNTVGFFTALLQFLDGGTEQGFIQGDERLKVMVHEDPDLLLTELTQVRCLPEKKLVQEDEI